MRPVNDDFITSLEYEQIIKISKEDKIPLYQIGNSLGVVDRGFWSKILNGKRPLPLVVRNNLDAYLADRAIVLVSDNSLNCL